MEHYSIPIHTDGIKSEYTLDFDEGDEKYNYFMKLNNQIPIIINCNTN